jgi:ParB family transcriptional regulator, chromosome partitioning protein
MTTDKPRRLGRGLEALISNAAAPGTAGSSDLRKVPISRIRPNPYQPRREFDPKDLADLESSLKASGLLQPITVRRRGEAYELIAGERRLRAATNLGWTEIPAIIRDFDDQTLLVLALVENLQRADLNAIEEARGYQRLIAEFQLTQQQVAEAVGKDRSTVANLLRILTLPESVIALVEKAHLSAGHARALLSLSDEREMLALAQEIVARGLSVREAEQRAKAASPGKPSASDKGSNAGAGITRSHESYARAAEEELRRYLQTDVQVSLASPERGSLKISFYSAEDFERLLDLVLREQRREQ